MNEPTTTPIAPPTATPGSRPLPWLVAGAALAAVTWAYWPNLCEMHGAWRTNPQYSYGYLVPVFAAFLLWVRRDKLDLDAAGPTWWGLAFLALAAGLRFVGVHWHYLWFDAMSLLPTLFGVTLLLGGWNAFRWAWPALAFLFFMIPLPFSAGIALSGPLQSLATLCSTFLLQTLSLPAVAEGNVIRINDHQIGIVEACSGLRMLVVFFALSVGMVLLIEAPLPDKLFLVASSVPIALVSNIARITVTGFLHEMADSKTAEFFYHDVAGWMMMPLALGLLWVELKVLERLFVAVPLPASRVSQTTRQQERTTSRPRPVRPRGTSRVAEAASPPEQVSPA